MKDCRAVGELLFFNDIYMAAMVKKIIYTLKTFLKCMNLLTNLKATKRPYLVCIYIYEILFNCNKIVVAWNWWFAIFILFSRFSGIFSLDDKFFHFLHWIFCTFFAWLHGFCHLGSRVEVTIKSLNCATPKKTKSILRKN